jgi:hypothetical protein
LTSISLYPSGGTIFEDELRSFCIAFPEMDLGSLKRSLKLLSHEMDLVFDDMFA